MDERREVAHDMAVSGLSRVSLTDRRLELEEKSNV